MRKTNINQVISYKDIKAGDRVRVSGELDIRDVRIASESPRLGKSATATVAAPTGEGDTSWAILESDTVTLLERDVQIEIPDDALVVYWQDEDDCDYYARKIRNDRWQDSNNQEHDSAAELIEEILDNSFDGYKVDSFEVLKREKPKYAQGGFVHGSSLPPNPFAGGAPVTLSAASIARLGNAVLGGMVR